MKRIFTCIPIIVLLFLSFNAIAQDNSSSSANESFSKGTNVISLGVGIGGTYSYWNSGYTETPNIVASYENGTFGNVGPGTISLGALISYKAIAYNYTNINYYGYYYDEKWTYYIIGLRSAYHWNFTHSPKCDPYAGAMLGYYYIGYTFSSNDPYYKNPSDPYYYLYNNTYNSYLALSLYVGFRFYITPAVGLWAELGYGYTNLALGINFKF